MLWAAGMYVQWFEKNRGTMLLFAMVGSGLGNFMYTQVTDLFLNYFEEHHSSKEINCDAWRPTMRVGGIFSMILVIMASTVMRRPDPCEVEEHEGTH